MLQEIPHPQFLELLIENDQELLSLDLAQLRQRVKQATSWKEDGLWSDALVDYIDHTEKAQLIQLHWIAERDSFFHVFG